MYKINKGLILVMSVLLFFASPSFSVYANSIENSKLSKIAQEEELRVQEINDLYNQKQELYSEYYESNDQKILKKIDILESKLFKLGVTEYSWEEMNNKVSNINLEASDSIVTPNVVIPPSTSSVRWTTYRYNTVIWGRLHEMQIVMAEPTATGSSGPLANTSSSIRTKTTYNNAIQAVALTVLDIFKGDLASKIEYNGVPVGNIVKNLYDIAKSGSSSMSPTQTFDSIEYSTTANSSTIIKYGFIKVSGQPDYEQKFVYVGNRVSMTYSMTLSVYYYINGVLQPDQIFHKENAYHESESYNNIVLNVAQNPNNSRSYVIYSKNKYLNYLPYKFFNDTHYHYVPGLSYVEHGLSMYDYYIFYY